MEKKISFFASSPPSPFFFCVFETFYVPFMHIRWLYVLSFFVNLARSYPLSPCSRAAGSRRSAMLARAAGAAAAGRGGLSSCLRRSNGRLPAVFFERSRIETRRLMSVVDRSNEDVQNTGSNDARNANPSTSPSQPLHPSSGASQSQVAPKAVGYDPEDPLGWCRTFGTMNFSKNPTIESVSLSRDHPDYIPVDDLQVEVRPRCDEGCAFPGPTDCCSAHCASHLSLIVFFLTSHLSPLTSHLSPPCLGSGYSYNRGAGQGGPFRPGGV